MKKSNDAATVLDPKYPIYIVSKGRWESRLTSRALESMGIHYRIVIEAQEYQNYSLVIDPNKILVLPFANLGQGSIPARNWIWEHSIREGYDRHWILDDNIEAFLRLHNNKYYTMRSGASLRAMEDFVDRYSNVLIAGPFYSMFLPAKKKYENPFCVNTRIYSCILLSNKIHHRWRGRYNEDTDLSLRILKDGFCTIQFRAFPVNKISTMSMRGGNTDELYGQTDSFDGRLEMARSLEAQHPDVVKITQKWGRWQHQVDYRPFKNNRLIRRPGLVIPKGVNNYGMTLRNRRSATQLRGPLPRARSKSIPA